MFTHTAPLLLKRPPRAGDRIPERFRKAAGGRGDRMETLASALCDQATAGGNIGTDSYRAPPYPLLYEHAAEEMHMPFGH